MTPAKLAFAVFLGLLAALVAPLTVLAAPLGNIANPIIDQVQGELVRWIVGAAFTAFWGAATWFGSVIGWRFIEKMNRATLQEAAERYANGIVDQIQARYLNSATPDLSDLVDLGIGYIKSGNAGTVKQSRITDDRLGAYVSAAIQQTFAVKLRGGTARVPPQ